MTLQIFRHFFHHKFVTFLQSTSLPQPTAHRRCATNLTALPLTPPRRYPSQQRIADALLTSRLCLSLPHIATPANGASQMRYSLETPFVRSAAEDAWGYRRPTHPALRRCATSPPSPPRPRERSRFQLTPDSVGGTRIAADAPQMRRGRAAANALLPYIYSGTALRCISPSPLHPRTRCPGLTENGSALRTAPSLP